MSPTVLSAEERKARRAERRLKQRANNLLRAKKMHQARAEYTKRQDQASPGSLKDTSFVGCSGWYYWRWKGLFYPEDLNRNDWFAYYSRRFTTVELNAPFYSWPTVNSVKAWARQCGRNFVYSVKVPELITHIKRFEGTKRLIQDFYFVQEILGPHMGCFLFQLPPSFHYSPGKLRKILSQLDPAKRNVLEFRHPSWWNESVFRALREQKIIFCSCSAPRLPDTLVKTSDDIYIRFHGPVRWYRHNYSRGEIEDWSERIKKSGAKTVWAYFNNDMDGNAPINARQLENRLTKGSLKPVRLRSRI